MKRYQILFILICASLYAQNTALNHSKYWFYRYRLRNEFMNLGEDACGKPSGKMIPSGSRYKNSVKYDTVKIDGVDRELYHPHRGFGDGTSHLGIYMAVLASEFELLKKSNKTRPFQLDSLRKELYWAMMAYERLDRNAEGGDDLQPNGMALGDCNSDENLNGFFMREDDGPLSCSQMRRNYFERRDGSRLPITNEAPTLGPVNMQTSTHVFKNNKNVDHFSCEYNELRPDNCAAIADFGNKAACYLSRQFIDPKECTGADHFWNSPDQMSNLMVGFAYIVKLMGNEGWNGYIFKDMAKEYCRRMGTYFDSKHARWKIMLPNHDKITAYGGKFEMGVYAYGIARSLDAIVNERWRQSNIFDAHDYTSRMENFSPSLWQTLNYPSGKIWYDANFKGRSYNNALISQNAAVGNSWQEGLVPVKKDLFTVRLPYVCRRPNCKMTCLMYLFGNCVIPKDLCQDICYNEETVECYTYSLSPNLVAAALEGNNNVASKVISTFALAGLNITNSVTQWAQDLGLCMSYIHPLPRITINTTSNSLAKYGAQTNTELFGLEHSLLHDDPTDTDINRIRDYLNSAPCSGPHYKPYFDPHNYPDDPLEQQSSSEGVRGWHTENRFEKSNIDSEEANLNSVGYPGLDYMLLHNTYHILMNRTNNQDPDGVLHNFVNEHRRHISGVVYPLADGRGSTAKRLVENGYESLELANVTVAGTGNMEFRSGLGVKISGTTKLTAGSTVKVGAKYEYPCNLNTGQYNELSYPTNLQRTAPAETSVSNTVSSNDTQFYEEISQRFATELDKNKDILVQSLKKPQTVSAYQSIAEFVAKNPAPVQSSGMRMAQTSEDMTIVPNPTSGPTTVKVRTGQQGMATLQVYDTFGYLKSSFTESISSETFDWLINLSHLPSGLYNMVYTQENLHIAKQFHKQ